MPPATMRCCAGIVEQFRDAEIEQLHVAFRVDQDVARFQIAMHDEVAMRVTHRRADVEGTGECARRW